MRNWKINAMALAAACLAPLAAQAGVVDDFQNSFEGKAWKQQRLLDLDTPLSENSMIGTHNSFNSSVDTTAYRYLDPQQSYSVYDQLRLGARYIELDVHWTTKMVSTTTYRDELLLCHGESNHAGCSMFDKYLSEDLQDIEKWLKSDEAKDQVLILYIEGYLNTHQDELRDMVKHYIGGYLYRPKSCMNIPDDLTKAQVLAAGKQVIVYDDQRRDCDDYGYDTFAFKGLGGIGRRAEDMTKASLAAGKRVYYSGSDIARYLAEGINTVNLDYLSPSDGRLRAAVWSWAEGEPNNTGNNEHCAISAASGRWNDYVCTASARYACRDDSKNWKITQAAGAWRYGPETCAREFGDGFKFGTPANATENKSLNAAKGATEAWLGYSDLAKEGQWSRDLYLWDERQPDNMGGTEHCAASWGSGRLNDASCAENQAFACKNSAGEWFVTQTTGPWTQGQEACQAMNSSYVFAYPGSWRDYQRLLAAKAAAGRGTAWVAYNDAREEGNWRSRGGLYASAVGGNGGESFDMEVHVPKQLNQIFIRTGRRLDQISVVYNNGDMVTYGGDGGSSKTLWLDIRAGERLTQATLCSEGKHVDYVKFTSSKGRSIEGGERKGSCQEVRVEDIAGFYGRSGKFVDRLGVIYK